MAEINVDLETARVADQVERAGERARDGFERVGDVTGRAETADGAVRVAVAPGGLLSDVRVTDAALRAGPDSVAQEIMRLAHRATRRAGDRMYRALAPALGPDGERHLNALGYEPFPEDEDEDEGEDENAARGRLGGDIGASGDVPYTGGR